MTDRRTTRSVRVRSVLPATIAVGVAAALMVPTSAAGAATAPTAAAPAAATTGGHGGHDHGKPGWGKPGWGKPGHGKPGHGGWGSCERRSNSSYDMLLSCVTLKGVRARQAALQRIADRNDDPNYPGTRAAGTKGYSDSVRYVKKALKRAGYKVTLNPFEFQFSFPAVLEQLTPTEGSYKTGSFTGSGAGDVTGGVIPVDINLTGDRASDSGCEAADFDGLDFSGSSDIALIQRGTCAFADKVTNAQDAGAEAVVIFNQGNSPDREPLIIGTLDPLQATIPVVGASFEQGEALAADGATAHVKVLPTETRTDYNVIADKRGWKNPDNVVMAGAHLDSVQDGPGINDDGSGSAAILETAVMMAKVKAPNSLRFAFWGAEEEGLIGSTAYVDGLSDEQRDDIALYMNYDMIGSPNYIQMVYDADQSTFESPVDVPDGSTAIEDLYESYYTKIGEPYDDTAFDGRSDYDAFIANGIPAGGLFTGAEEVKTDQQAEIWGGTAGEAFDPCYHQACDDLSNVSRRALAINSKLVAFAQLTFAFSTESVNGVPGRPVPGRPWHLPAPAGPQGTFVE